MLLIASRTPIFGNKFVTIQCAYDCYGYGYEFNSFVPL